MTRTGDTLGYARVSTQDQSLTGQVAQLQKAGAIRVFEDVISGNGGEIHKLGRCIGMFCFLGHKTECSNPTALDRHAACMIDL